MSKPRLAEVASSGTNMTSHGGSLNGTKTSTLSGDLTDDPLATFNPDAGSLEPNHANGPPDLTNQFRPDSTHRTDFSGSEYGDGEEPSRNYPGSEGRPEQEKGVEISGETVLDLIIQVMNDVVNKSKKDQFVKVRKEVSENGVSPRDLAKKTNVTSEYVSRTFVLAGRK
jgi:hypothetical protein